MKNPKTFLIILLSACFCLACGGSSDPVYCATCAESNSEVQEEICADDEETLDEKIDEWLRDTPSGGVCVYVQ